MGKLAAPVRADKEMMFTNRQLVALMWPLLLEQLLAITVGLADSLMVATVGDAAISAVSLVDSISNLMIYIFSAMATGGAAVAGQYIGQRQKEDACNAGQQLIALLGAVSIFFVALLYLFRTQILTVMFGHIEPDVMAATNTYYLYVMASIPGIALYNGGAALFRTMGHSDVSLKVSLLMNSINVIGNAVLIFGFGMDVAGVAIPTLVSRTVAAIVILSLLFNRDLMLHLSDIRGFHLNMRLMKNIFYIGVPSGVENGMFQLGRLVLFSLISTFGTASMVANAIGNTISNFNCFAGQAINLGLAAVVSQCVGAGEFDQARVSQKNCQVDLRHHGGRQPDDHRIAAAHHARLQRLTRGGKARRHGHADPRHLIHLHLGTGVYGAGLPACGGRREVHDARQYADDVGRARDACVCAGQVHGLRRHRRVVRARDRGLVGAQCHLLPALPQRQVGDDGNQDVIIF